jgi:hypothetical protein
MIGARLRSGFAPCPLAGVPNSNPRRHFRQFAGRADDNELPIVLLMNIRQHVPARLALDLPEWRTATRILAQAELVASK